MAIELNVRDRDFWHRYSGSDDGHQVMGIRPLDWQKFQLTSSGRTHITTSMLTVFELSLLYALARHAFRGDGFVIDAGPLLGASTFAFARGLADNPGLEDEQRKARIYSFDLFSSHGYEGFLRDTKPTAVTGSLLPEFMATNIAHLDSIVVHQGDFAGWCWPATAPVKLLFIDLAKTWSLNNHIIQNYFPALVGGQSILIQQDYIHFNEYWIHLTMEYYKDHFDLLGMMYGATAYYLCVKPFMAGDYVNLEALPYPYKMDLLKAARSRADPLVRQVMKTAAAKCALEHGRLDDAQSLLNDVDLSIQASHPTLQVGGIAVSNRAAVAGMLQRARAQTAGASGPSP